MSSLFIRKPDLRELTACFSLDAGYETDYIWQMHRSFVGGGITISFQKVKLPRTLEVAGAPFGESIARHWEADWVLIAKESSHVCGFVDVSTDNDEDTGVIEHLVVDRLCRRNGVGTLLLREIKEMAFDRGLRQLVIPVPSKNYPAILFCQANGLEFVGYNDLYYRNRDVALLFGMTLP